MTHRPRGAAKHSLVRRARGGVKRRLHAIVLTHALSAPSGATRCRSRQQSRQQHPAPRPERSRAHPSHRRGGVPPRHYELSPQVDKSIIIFNTVPGARVLKHVPPSLPRAISVEPWRPRRSRPRRPTSRRPRASRCASLCLLTACSVCVRALAPLWLCTRVCAGARARRAFCRGGGMLVDAADPGHAGRRARRLMR